MVRIVNWLVTRKCNLQCSYCRIARSYESPKEYPKIIDFYKNEVSLDFIVEALRRFKNHNPECFHIFYGGEPLLRLDLKDIVAFCNKESINYTVITNGTEELEPYLEELLSTTKLAGLTTSVDPVIFSREESEDILKKSLAGLERLSKYKEQVGDLVAEVTVGKDNLKFLHDLTRELTSRRITSSITFIDIAKSPYYDFSNITDTSVLVSKEEALPVLNAIDDDDDVDVHMKHTLLPKLYQALPSNLDCKIEESVHNLTIDSDGTVRLCLRIRGVKTPEKTILQYLNSDGSIGDELKERLAEDKRSYCKLCNWTCPIMSSLVECGSSDVKYLIHSERRDQWV